MAACALVVVTLAAMLEEPSLPPVHVPPTVDSLPFTLDECFDLLPKVIPAAMEEMRRGSEVDMSQYHHRLGTWMRNNWGLWAHGPLYEYFHELGLEHPDDMSSVILTSFWRHLHEQPLDVERQVREHQAYWRVAREPEPASNTACPSGIQTVLSLGYSMPDGSLGRVHMGKCCANKRVWSYEVDRGWYVPTAEQSTAWDKPDERWDPCAARAGAS